MALPLRLLLAATLATTLAYSNAVGSEKPSRNSIATSASLQIPLLQETQDAQPILDINIRPERIVHERVWILDSTIAPARLIEVCDESIEYIEADSASATAPSAADIVAALTILATGKPVLNDPHFNSVIDADIVTLATDEQSLFDLDLTHGLVVPIQDLSTRTLRFGFHLSLLRAF